MAATLTVGERARQARRPRSPAAPDRALRQADGPRRRRAAPSVVPRTNGTATRRGPGPADAAAGQPGISRHRDVRPRGLRLHPAARMSPTAGDLDAITREALVDFHATHYVPDHAAIAFAGDISMADARKLVETKLAAWKKAGVRRAGGRRSGRRSARPKVYLDRPSGLGADDADRRHAGDHAHRSRLRRADGHEPRARRDDGPAVQAPARGEGLHLRLGSGFRRRSTAAPGRRPRACAPRSPSRR